MAYGDFIQGRSQHVFSGVDGFFLTCPCHKMKKKKTKKKTILERSVVELVMRYDTNGVKWTHRSKEKEQWRMWRIQGRGLGTRYLPLFLDQTTEAWRAPLPPYFRVWMTAGLPPTPSISPYLKVWNCHWRVIVEAVLWVKLLKVFFRLKQLNSLSGKKIPYHFWNLQQFQNEITSWHCGFRA